MDYFPSNLESVNYGHCHSLAKFLLSSCFAFVFVFLLSKSNKTDLSPGGFPASLLLLPFGLAQCSTQWQSAQTLKIPHCILASQIPDPAQGAKKLQCLHVACCPLLRRRQDLWYPGSKSSWPLCYSLGGQQEGNLPAVLAGDLKFGDL